MTDLRPDVPPEDQPLPGPSIRRREHVPAHFLMSDERRGVIVQNPAVPIAPLSLPTVPAGHIPAQWTVERAEPPIRRPVTVLVADPAGALADFIRPALVGLVGCSIVHATSVADVHELVANGVTGELAMVSVRFNGATSGVIRALRAAGWARILALTTSAVALAPVVDAVNAGATGVLKVAGAVEVLPDELNPTRQLSARELDVVRLVAEGWSNKEIGHRLSLSSLTVKNHLARIGRKFGVGDRAHIVAIACRGGVIPLS